MNATLHTDDGLARALRHLASVVAERVSEGGDIHTIHLLALAAERMNAAAERLATSEAVSA